ncbi:MAG: hypothetical protein FJ083_03360 [Cyanobacteria bacterium K_Offshore_surface_m2_239]|nr:hypothetical protein [Cyanobacteria bacterium K_Offshore_surface_m2_239]
MADPHRQASASSGGVFTAAALGVLAGAGGFAWWLWRQSRHRASSSASKVLTDQQASERQALPDRVQQLNQAIEEVRRQLESLPSQP